MADAAPAGEGHPPGLNQISTHWPLIVDPVQFAMRYAPAIRQYLVALLKNADDADDVAQEFVLRGLLRGFIRTDHLRGRFRDYLKTAVRNAALTHLRQQPDLVRGNLDLDHLPQPEGECGPGEEEWLAQWRQCVLDRTWQALERHQEKHRPHNLYHTVLRLMADHPDEDSSALAARAAALAGRPLRADAFRKQLSHARQRFVELLLAEVRQTLESPTPDRLEEELIEVGLMPYVRDMLPADWKTCT